MQIYLIVVLMSTIIIFCPMGILYVHDQCQYQGAVDACIGVGSGVIQITFEGQWLLVYVVIYDSYVI